MAIVLEKQIIAFLDKHYNKSYTMEQLAHELQLQQSNEFKELVKTVAALESENKIVLTKRGKIRLPKQTVTIDGVFRANERGFGFVSVEGEESDVFIPARDTLNALNGDTVEIDITKPATPWEDKAAEGKIVRVLERATTRVVGEFTALTDAEKHETGFIGKIKPADKRISRYTVWVQDEGLHPVTGEIVVAEITDYIPNEESGLSMTGMVTQTLGHKDDPGVDILSIVSSYDIPTEFPEEVMAQAEQIPEEIDLAHIDPDRRDLRDQQIVTIDGESTKDFDDAVTVRKLENGNYFLGVHIADVAYYVEEGTPLDREAEERGTSVYLTDRVISMLPRRLSNGICSLNPQVPRYTLSCEMEIDHRGEVVRYEIFPSLIQTTERMTYTDVNKILTDRDEATIERYRDLVPMFEEMKELHEILEKMRYRRGAISFDDHESIVKVDDEGKPVAIELRERGISERMIESFMLAANETVAYHFQKQHLPFIYRIHEQPKEEKLQRFFEFVTAFGLTVKGSKEHISAKELQQVLAKVEGTPEEPVISTMMLRSMQQARYDVEPVGHYGLAAEDYTHFTSPIRRYPDLMVHRLIRAYATKPIEKTTKEHFAEVLPDIAEHSSKMERRAVDAERETDAMKKAEFMEQHVGETFEGVVSSVVKFGLFIELSNTIEGLVHINELDDDYYQYFENQLMLVGERTGKVFKIGQKVEVEVTRADAETREIDFKLIRAEELPKQKLKATKKNRKKNNRSKSARNKEMKQNHSAAHSDKKEKKKAKGKQPFYKKAMKKKRKKRH